MPSQKRRKPSKTQTEKSIRKKRTVQKEKAISGRVRRRKERRRAIGKALLWTLLLSVLLVLTGTAVWFFTFDTIDLNEYVTVSYTGYDSAGTADVRLRDSKKYGYFLESAECHLAEKNGKLKNGDILKLTFTYDKELAKQNHLRVKTEEGEVTVSGLPEGIELSADDIFEGLHMTYEGMAAMGSVTISNESTDEFLQNITYQMIDQQDFYDLGETFRITAELDSKDALEKGYHITAEAEELTREYPAESDQRYLTDPSEITPEILQELNRAGASLFGAADEYGLRVFSEAHLMPIWVNGKTTFTWQNPRPVSAYLNTLKPEYFGKVKSHYNDVRLVYVATLMQADGLSCEARVVVRFTNLMRDADGNYDLALDSGKIIAASYSNAKIKDFVNSEYDEEYQSQKIE